MTPTRNGFTLIEVMVALLIFSIIATAGVALLSFSVRAQAASGAKLDDLGALQRTLSIMSADLAQATARPVRDEAGTVALLARADRAYEDFLGPQREQIAALVTHFRGILETQDSRLIEEARAQIAAALDNLEAERFL